MNKYSNFQFLYREGESYVYLYVHADGTTEEKAFDTPQDAQHWYDGLEIPNADQ